MDDAGAANVMKHFFEDGDYKAASDTLATYMPGGSRGIKQLSLHVHLMLVLYMYVCTFACMNSFCFDAIQHRQLLLGDCLRCCMLITESPRLYLKANVW